MRIHTLPTNMPRLVSVRNLLSCRWPPKRSRSRKTENSSLQSHSRRTSSFSSSSLIKVPLPHVIRDIDRNGAGIGRHHHVDPRLDRLLTEYEKVRGLFAPALDFIGLHIAQRLAWADRGAHRLLANRRAVVTHIALHHLFELRDDLRYAEGACQNAI